MSAGGMRLAPLFQSLHPMIRWSSIALFLIAGSTLLAAGLDSRIIAGQNIWIKPFKFSVSIAIYFVTLGFVLQFLEHRARNRYAVAAVSFMLLEIAIILFQAIRGVPSHHNFSTAFDGALYTIMGVAIILNTLMLVGLLVQLRKLGGGLHECYLLSVKLGLVLLIAGSMVGVLMSIRRSHSVGQLDGAGPVVPLLNWNLVAGDLRIPHFVGIHAIQILMLAGWLTARTAEKHQEVLTFHRFLIIGIFLVLALVFVLSLIRAQSGLH